MVFNLYKKYILKNHHLIFTCALFMILFFISISYANDSFQIDEDFRSDLDRPIPTESVSAVFGKRAELPCDITSKIPEDGISMVLWFRDSDGEPLYSFDVRNPKSFSNPKLWSSPSAFGSFGSRASFQTISYPARLVIENIKAQDEFVYRCRVDFKNSPTRNSKVNLTIIVPPHTPAIYDEKRRDRTKLSEAYNEGSDINLKCEVIGGKPTPRVDWYLEEQLIDGDYQKHSNGVTVNHLLIRSVTREHQNKRLSCHASNTNLTPPTAMYIILDINLRPLSLNITTKDEQLSSGKSYDMECKCYGSKPPAHITWHKGGKYLASTGRIHLSEENMKVISIMSFTPTAEDDGKYLTCKAENPSIPNSVLEDKWRLNVHYIPILTLNIGSKLTNEIREGTDVYFECSIMSNPRTNKLSWYHNNGEISLDISSKVIKTDQSLVLQKVKRTAAGEFKCSAWNSEGQGTSNVANLSINYVPVCKSNEEVLLAAQKQETVVLKCQVDSSPPVLEYLWTFNNSGDIKGVQESQFLSSGTSSSINYTPTTDSQFGTLSCKARNALGSQMVPCLFQIIAAGLPQPLTNCLIANDTNSYLQVQCNENFDGGLPQYFVMELWESLGTTPAYNLTTYNVPPVFHLSGIDSSIDYNMRIYAVNMKGRSEVVVLKTARSKGVEKYTRPSIDFSWTSVTTVLTVLGLTSITLTCIACVAVCRRRNHTTRYPKIENENHMPCHGAMLISEDTVLDVTDKNSLEEETEPDIIPNAVERRLLKTFANDYNGIPLNRSKQDDKCPNSIRHQSSRDKNSFEVRTKLLNSSKSATLGASDTVVVKAIHNHKLAPEVVTASPRLQESCI